MIGEAVIELVFILFPLGGSSFANGSLYATSGEEGAARNV
jgi:hypothetical protein